MLLQISFAQMEMIHKRVSLVEVDIVKFAASVARVELNITVPCRLEMPTLENECVLNG